MAYEEDPTPALTLDELRTRTTLTVGEAAKVLGISKVQAYRLARDGSLPAITIGANRKVISAPLLYSLITTPQH